MFCCSFEECGDSPVHAGMSEDLKAEIESHLVSTLMVTEKDLAFGRRLSSRLPSIVIDAHTHLGSFSEVETVPHWLLNHVISTVLIWPRQNAHAFEGSVLPGTKIRSARFPVPIFGINFDKAVEYVRSSCLSSGDYWVTFGHKSRREAVHQELADPACRGLKCYHRSYDPPAGAIADVFLMDFLEACSALNKPIILHLPGSASAMEAELVELARAFPRLPIILAHCGMMESFDQENADALARIARFENIFVDTSMIMDSEVLRYNLRTFSYERVLFGSDSPLASYRAAYRRDSEGRYALYPTRPYSWLRQPVAEPIIECSLLYHVMVEQLLDAAENLWNGHAKAIEAIFCENARALFGDQPGHA